ncbi:MAG: efflux transporter periplasmic adaptor subunit [Oceanospirillaceae bacterium]|nr:efflux transporter periplasmic adaptor subunit [Oceanospirillaceae bacterium]MBT11748.1 efflux transporter periplasmic adaptor subunit [Oceanospirillaceae bacterium]|tara:strand:- start:89573 stop:90637 length:1065 start_codon:yes stop_codon:yes gene_type:complete
MSSQSFRQRTLRSSLKSALQISLLAAVLPTTAQAAESVSLEPVTVPVYFDLEATLEAVNESTISAQTSGAIKAVYYDVNDQVEKGALLLEIDDTQQQAELQQAYANLAQAKAQNEDAQVLLQRNTRLYKQGTLSKGEIDSTTARAKSAAAAVKAAQAALTQAREQLAYTKVKAPYAGLVKTRHVELGELVNPGQALMTGLSLDKLRAVADAPQRIASQYRSADQVTVRIGEQSVAPESVVLYPFADATHHSVRLRANLSSGTTGADNRPLYPGQWTKIRVQTGERDVLLLPQSAILKRSELTSVYVLDDGQPELRQVRTGNLHNGEIEVLSGLQAGDKVITDALAQLAEISKGE